MGEEARAAEYRTMPGIPEGQRSLWAGGILMPRRPDVIAPRIPLFLIASVVSREVKKAGEELMRIVVKKVKGHYYDIRVRTRSVRRALLPEIPWADPSEYSMVVADP
jgi:hypothetical protein